MLLINNYLQVVEELLNIVLIKYAPAFAGLFSSDY